MPRPGEIKREVEMVNLISKVVENRILTAAEFQSLADVPAEVEWFANIENPK